jgi:hypothetical protein
MSDLNDQITDEMLYAIAELDYFRMYLDKCDEEKQQEATEMFLMSRPDFDKELFTRYIEIKKQAAIEWIDFTSKMSKDMNEPS